MMTHRMAQLLMVCLWFDGALLGAMLAARWWWATGITAALVAVILWLLWRSDR